MSKLRISDRHYYALFFFAFIMVYSIVIPGEMKLWKTDELTLSFHAVDYSMGFCSKFLPGAIYNFLFDSISEKQVSAYLSVLMILFFMVLSLFLERFMLRVEPEYRFTALLLILFFITGPSTFSIYVKVLGMLEAYWLFAAGLFFILLSKKSTYFLLFVPFIICILTYYVTWLCYIPFFSIIILYKITLADTRKEKVYLWICLIFSVAVAFALALYFALFEKNNLTYTLDEFAAIFDSKGIFDNYYRNTLYFVDNDLHIEANILEELLIRIMVNFKIVNFPAKIPLFLLLTPIVVFIYKFFFIQIKSCKDKLKKLSFVCIILLFAGTMISASFTTSDLIRWTGHAFLPLFASFLYVLYNEGNDAWKCVKNNIEKYSFATIMVFLVFYASIVYDPYFV